MIYREADLTFDNNTVYVSGEICFTNVMGLYAKSLSCFGSEIPLIFDFSKVKDSDSSGLALIIEWMREGEKRHQTVTFKAIPEGLLSIASAARLDKILSLNHS